MIDVIIPTYNSQKTIVETLSSLSIQRIKDKTKIYIVDDCSDNNYEKEISLFKDRLDITYIRNSKNKGPGYSRQVGIDNSSSEYILFIDADDQLYNCYSLEILYNTIKEDNLDVVMGYFYVEKNGDKKLSDISTINGCLHGKMYRRSYLLKNNIRFNYSRYSEDNSFNSIATILTKKIKLVEKIVYVYKDNANSLTNNKKKALKMYSSYLHNMLWVINILEKRNINNKILIAILVNSYIYIFDILKKNKNLKLNKIFIYCSKYEEKYKQYENMITNDDLFFWIEDNTIKLKSIKEFNKFREKFRKN